MPTGPYTFPRSLSDNHTIDPALQSTPKCCCDIDPASNPDLATPSKRMCYLAAGLANTLSGFVLISKACASHLEMSKLVASPVIDHVPHKLKHPDWSLLSSQPTLAQLPQRSVGEISWWSWRKPQMCTEVDYGAADHQWGCKCTAGHYEPN